MNRVLADSWMQFQINDGDRNNIHRSKREKKLTHKQILYNNSSRDVIMSVYQKRICCVHTCENAKRSTPRRRRWKNKLPNVYNFETIALLLNWSHIVRLTVSFATHEIDKRQIILFKIHTQVYWSSGYFSKKKKNLNRKFTKFAPEPILAKQCSVLSIRSFHLRTTNSLVFTRVFLLFLFCSFSLRLFFSSQLLCIKTDWKSLVT